MQVQATRYDAYKLMHEGVLALADAEQAGVRLDLEYCRRQKKKLAKHIELINSDLDKSDFIHKWRDEYGLNFNLNSGTQLSHMLFDVYKFKSTKKTKTGKSSTDEESLKQIDIPEVQQMLRARRLKKLGDYIDGFLREQVDGFIHTFFNLHLVITYRSSSDSPNLQNIPNRDKEAMTLVRKAIYARKGHQLLGVDFSGIEVGVAACYHKDKTMLEYLHDPKSDMHGDIAKQLFKLDTFDSSIDEYNHLRKATKNGFVFPQFYGDYHVNNALSLLYTWGELPNLASKAKWKPGQGVPLPGGIHLSDHFISKGIRCFDDYVKHVQFVEQDFWGNRFFEYAKWKETWLKKYQKNGFFESLTGFRYSGGMQKNEVINYAVQGSAFHCLLWSFIQVNKILKKYKMDSRLVLQIHDELIVDTHPAELENVADIIHDVTCNQLSKRMQWINVPMNVEAKLGPVDGSWNIKSKYSLTEHCFIK